jgi:hypothetical protein
MNERRAHERIDDLTGKFHTFQLAFSDHMKAHVALEASVKENVELTRATATNTGKLVKLFEGATNVREFFVWASPIAVVVAAVWAIFPWTLDKIIVIVKGWTW